MRNRLAKIAGHVKAIGRMIEDESNLTEILHQLDAIRSSLNRVAHKLVTERIKALVKDGLHAPAAADLEDMNTALEKILGLKSKRPGG